MVRQMREEDRSSLPGPTLASQFPETEDAGLGSGSVNAVRARAGLAGADGCATQG